MVGDLRGEVYWMSVVRAYMDESLSVFYFLAPFLFFGPFVVASFATFTQ